MGTLSDLSKYYRTSNATALATEIKQGQTAYIGGGVVTGDAYTPAMMEFDGSSGYYELDPCTTTGNKLTCVFRFNISDFTGTATQKTLVQMQGDLEILRLSIAVRSSDWATADQQGKMLVYVADTASATKALIFSNASVLDGANHTVFVEYDGDAGTFEWKMDGVEQDDTGVAARVAPVTGTLDAGTVSRLRVCVDWGLTASRYWPNDLGFFGYQDVGGLTWSDFMDTNGNPKYINEATYPAWNGGTAGFPAMTFDGSTGYYSETAHTTSGNKATIVCRFKRASFTGGGIERLFMIVGPLGYIRAGAILYASDHADSDRAGNILLQTMNSAGTNICRLLTSGGLIDNTIHTIFYSFDGDVGAATFYIDGADADDTGNADRIAPTTGTLDSGSAGLTAAYLGSDPTNDFGGEAGFFGYRDAYLTNWQDFMELDGTPKDINMSAAWQGIPLFWNKWGQMDNNKGSGGDMTLNGTVVPNGEQPLFWNPHGYMEDNRGSAGAMTKNGTIIVGDGGNR